MLFSLVQFRQACYLYFLMDRVNGLAALHVHKHLPLDLENMIDDFAAMYPRRMMMTNILND